MKIDETVSINLRAMRTRLGLTQAALAQMAGVSKETVSRLERGEGGNSKTIERLAEVMDVSPLALFAEVPRETDVTLKRVSAKAARLDKARYSAMLSQTVDLIVQDTKDKLYIMSVMPCVKRTFEENQDSLLAGLCSGGNAKSLLSVLEETLLYSIKESIFQEEGEEEDSLVDDLVDPDTMDELIEE